MTEALSHLHDGYVTGVRLREGGATIYLQTVNGSECELDLAGLEVLQMEDFRQGNIISHVEVLSGRTPCEHTEFDRLFSAPHPTAARQYQEAHARVLKRHITRIEAGEATLVIIVPSYGADLLAICRDATFRA